MEDAFDELPEEAIGVHWYGGSGVAQSINRRIQMNERNGVENTLTRILDEIGCEIDG